MEVVDYLIIGIIVLSALVSFARGFLREFMSLIGLVVACYIALYGAKHVAPYLVEQLANPTLRFWAAAAGLFVVALFFSAIVNYIVGKFMLSIGVNGTDRLAGILLGVVRGGVVVALFIIVANLLGLPINNWWPESKLLGQFDELAVMISDFGSQAYDTWQAEQAATSGQPPEPSVAPTPQDPIVAPPSQITPQ